MPGIRVWLNKMFFFYTAKLTETEYLYVYLFLKAIF